MAQGCPGRCDVVDDEKTLVVDSPNGRECRAGQAQPLDTAAFSLPRPTLSSPERKCRQAQLGSNKPAARVVTVEDTSSLDAPEVGSADSVSSEATASTDDPAAIIAEGPTESSEESTV